MSHQGPVIVVVSALGGMTDQLVELMRMDSGSHCISDMLDSFRRRYDELIISMIDADGQTAVRDDISQLLAALQKDMEQLSRDAYFQDNIVSWGSACQASLLTECSVLETLFWCRAGAYIDSF